MYVNYTLWYCWGCRTSRIRSNITESTIMATVKSSQVNITDLDFDDIASNLKEYLKGSIDS